MRIEQIFKASNNIFRHNILNSDISFKLTFLLFLPPPSCSSLPLLYYLIYLTFFLFCLLDFAGLDVWFRTLKTVFFQAAEILHPT